MKKLAFFLFVVILSACKDRTSESLGPNRANNFVGTYYTNTSSNDRNTFNVWIVTRKANNKLGIAYYVSDTYKIGSGTATSNKREVYFLENVTVNSDSTFTIAETDNSASTPTRIQGSGSLKTAADGSARILINLDFTGSNNQPVRPSGAFEFQKVNNIIDADPKLSDFDYIGTYSTELPDDSKTATHRWIVGSKSSNTLSLDYSINDRYKQGSIAELLNSYAVNELRKLNNTSLAMDLSIEETNSKDKIRIKALGNKLVRAEGQPQILAVVVKIVNETKKITRIEYLELKKQ